MTAPTIDMRTLDLPVQTSAASLSQQILAAAHAFRVADAAAEKARAGLTPGQESGPDGLPAGAEYLFEEAQHRYEKLLELTGLDAKVFAIRARPLSDQEIDDILGAAAGYTAPPKVVNTAQTSATDWRDSIGKCDWGASR